MDMPIPVTVITGFLGAGKTTLLNRLLQEPAAANSVVIVNEFGEIGLDHLLVAQSRDDTLVMLASGCLCCTVRGDLVATLEDLLARRDDGDIAFRRVIIETTGLADPAPVLQSVMGHPVLARRCVLDGVVTLVDAVNGAAALDLHREAVKQVAIADRIVVSKTDLPQADPEAVAALLRRLRRLNPAAPVLDGARGEAVAAALLDAGPFDPTGKVPDVAGWLRDEAVRDQAAHAGHDHGSGRNQDPDDVNRHDAHVRAFCLTAARPVPRAALDMLLTLLPLAHGERMLRLKGIVCIAEDPDHPVVVHAVHHVVHPPVALPAWPDGDRRTRLVLITRDLSEHFVQRLWGAFLDEPAIDAPDRAALMDNPLALRHDAARR